MGRCCCGVQGPAGPEGPAGPQGPAGEGACISTDDGNQITEGSDGCLYVAPAAEPLFGVAFSGGTTDLQPTAVDVYVPVTGAQVTLPELGTYRIDVDIRSRIVNETGDNGWLTGRLFNQTTGIAVANSERFINQAFGPEGTRNVTAPITAHVTVTAGTIIQLEAARHGISTEADIRSNAEGLTRIAYQRLAG